MIYEFFVVPNTPRPSVEVMVSILDLIRDGADEIQITHIPMGELMKMSGGKANPTDAFVLRVRGDLIFNLRSLFLFIEKHALWPL